MCAIYEELFPEIAPGWTLMFKKATILLTQIEVILNSPFSFDPNDHSFLTPTWTFFNRRLTHFAF